MSTERRRHNNVAYAWFKDGAFIGWFYGLGAQVCDAPKLYADTDRQEAIITSNFRSKLRKFREGITLEEAGKDKGVAGIGEIMQMSGMNKLADGKEFELRKVETPFYDGPNPDYDKEEAQRIRDIRWEALVAEGINDIPAGLERTRRVNEFDKAYEGPTYDVPNWIYGYEGVEEWAETEPTEFIGTITEEE